MAKKREIRYYLLNGKNGVGNTLDLLDDGKLKRDFKDIATLDLKTMEIPYSSASEVLQEYNKNIDLSGTFYDIQYPYKKVESKAFSPLFKMESEKCKYYMDHLKYFAEQRDRKIQKGDSVKLDNNTILESYINTLLYNILKNNNRRVIRSDSIVGVSIKEEIEKGLNQMRYKSADEYLRSCYKLKHLLDHYTQVRNLTLEYMSSIGDQKISTRREISRFSYFENYGMEERETAIIQENKKSDKEVKYYQMTLKDFSDLMN